MICLTFSFLFLAEMSEFLPFDNSDFLLWRDLADFTDLGVTLACLEFGDFDRTSFLLTGVLDLCCLIFSNDLEFLMLSFLKFLE
jgi:hypothetical protein